MRARCVQTALLVYGSHLVLHEGMPMQTLLAFMLYQGQLLESVSHQRTFCFGASSLRLFVSLSFPASVSLPRFLFLLLILSTVYLSVVPGISTI